MTQVQATWYMLGCFLAMFGMGYLVAALRYTVLLDRAERGFRRALMQFRNELSRKDG
jgi:hypothetical protein